MSDEKDNQPSPPPATPAPEKIDPMRAEVPSRGVDFLKQRFPNEVVEVTYYAGDAMVRLRA
ncbi:MAG: hypothetical protein O7A63_05530, partial [Acidobacteria bacterium]|nr:hypothetical protein [Acidobacteriota bacterium]